MAFFLMGIMSIIFLVLSLGTTFLSFYKQGKLITQPILFFTLSALIFIELFIGFTSLPTNYLVQRIIDIVLMITLVGNIFLYKKSFHTSRVILGVLSILALLNLGLF